MKKYLKPFLCLFFIVLIGLIPVSILYYFNIFSDKITNYLLWLIMIVSIVIGSYKFSYNMKYKGIVNGIIFFIITFLILLLLNLIMKPNMSKTTIIYGLFLLLSSIIGGIIGKNAKTDDN